MRKQHFRLSLWFVAALVALPVSALAVASDARPVDDEGDALEQTLWSDEAFQKRFLGSYGFNSEIEPQLAEVEREQMREEILPLLEGEGQDYEAAIAKLEELTNEGSSAVFDFTLGNLHFQLENLEEAMEAYEDAVEKFPDFRRAHKNLGLIEVRTGEYEDAIESLSRVIELGGGDGLTFGLLGLAYTQTQQWLAAESAYRNAMLLDRDTVDWKVGLTQAVLKQRKFGEAVTLTEELITRFPDRSDLWLLQGNAYLGLGEPMKAAENFELVARMGEAKAPTMKLLGDIYVNEQLYDLASRAYANAIELAPDKEVGEQLRFVEILAQRSQLEQAGRLLDQIEESYPELAGEERKKVLQLKARLQVAGGGGGEAVDVLEEIIEIDPLDGEALMLLGSHYLREQQPEQASFYFERAASLDEFEADAKIRLAQIHVDDGKYNEALPLLKRAQEIRPRDDVARYIEQVERLARTPR